MRHRVDRLEVLTPPPYDRGSGPWERHSERQPNGCAQGATSSCVALAPDRHCAARVLERPSLRGLAVAHARRLGRSRLTLRMPPGRSIIDAADPPANTHGLSLHALRRRCARASLQAGGVGTRHAAATGHGPVTGDEVVAPLGVPEVTGPSQAANDRFAAGFERPCDRRRRSPRRMLFSRCTVHGLTAGVLQRAHGVTECYGSSPGHLAAVGRGFATGQGRKDRASCPCPASEESCAILSSVVVAFLRLGAAAMGNRPPSIGVPPSTPESGRPPRSPNSSTWRRSWRT